MIIQDCKYREIIDNLLVLLIGGIPIAMPTVLSVTMAIGSHKLSLQRAITKIMIAIEELAGMDMLCSDRTGIDRILHHNIGLPEFSQELWCFQTVICAQSKIKELQQSEGDVEPLNSGDSSHSGDLSHADSWPIGRHVNAKKVKKNPK